MNNRRSALALLALTTLATPAVAQDWPKGHLTMVIPFAAGGPTDILGRLLADKLGEILGQRVIVENVGGAGGMLGASRVAKAAPDGSQFVLGTVGTHAVNQTLYKKPLYDASADFTPVALVADVPLVLITRKDLPAKNLQEFIAYTKANHQKMTYGSAGPGSALHLGCLLLNDVLGTDVKHVPYRGSAPAMNDLTTGRIDFMCEVLSSAISQIEGKAVNVLATMTMDRAKVIPDVPTAHEQGLAKFEAYTWNAVFLPKGAAPATVAKLREAIVKAMADPELRARADQLGIALVAPERTTSAYLAGFVKSEIEKWAAPIKKSGVSVE